jgi:predicted HicB family RNase H-like nuclease
MGVPSLRRFTVFCALAQKTPNKRDNVEKVTKSIRIDPKLWRRARVRALGEGRTIQDLVADSLRKYLADKKAGRKGGD